jgi:hypothetical protein
MPCYHSLACRGSARGRHIHHRRNHPAGAAAHYTTLCRPDSGPCNKDDLASALDRPGHRSSYPSSYPYVCPCLDFDCHVSLQPLARLRGSRHRGRRRFPAWHAAARLAGRRCKGRFPLHSRRPADGLFSCRRLACPLCYSHECWHPRSRQTPRRRGANQGGPATPCGVIPK